ncbi:hypothetical protein F511_27059 [Dorcoceras hygrometricum]|uniref:Uncharacterized protein n=1 Tax=Dorcoceras hygrometricum TaxID=472368 RepID=A0A2Z7CPI3_9LAMI|nr:hypothetical protein F511_27059 [Dorcoceras hygrometricum]
MRFEVATGTSREKRCIVLFLRLNDQLLYQLLHLHTRILLSSPVLLAMPILLNCEYQDAMFKDERVSQVSLLVVALTQLEEPQEVDRVSQLAYSIYRKYKRRRFVSSGYSEGRRDLPRYVCEICPACFVTSPLRHRVGVARKWPRYVCEICPACFVGEITKRQQFFHVRVVAVRSCSPYWGLTPCPSGAWLVSLFVLFSGNPGFSAGRGFNPAGGAPGGG